MSQTTLERVQADTRAAMKAGERERVAVLRMLASALHQDAKLGDDDPVAVLQRERKKRLEAAEAYANAGRAEQEAGERAEAEVIAGYLPEQIGDAELQELVTQAIESSGASSIKEMGKVIGIVMPQVKGRADGKRVSSAVRERLGA